MDQEGDSPKPHLPSEALLARSNREALMTRSELKTTAEEDEQLSLCYLVLTEEQVADCFEEAEEMAGITLNESRAGELLVTLLTEIVIRNVREEGGEK
jgi:hypothetical protein